MEDTLKKFSTTLYSSAHELFLSFGRQIPDIILAILIIAVGTLIANQLAKISRKAISMRTSDQITINFLAKAVKILLISLVIMYGLKVGGLQGIASGIFTAAGASAVIIGFAFRDIGENFISGIILSFSRPFNVGDTVKIGDIFGRVNTIEFRYTKLRTFDGKDVYIPNSDVIKKPVFNFTEDGFIRFDFLVGIAYENDIEKAQEVILDVLQNHSSIYSAPDHQSFVCTEELATNAVSLKVHFWIKTYEYGMDALKVKGSVVSLVKAKLMSSGFNLPANIVEMKMYETQSVLPLNIKESPIPDKSTFL